MKKQHILIVDDVAKNIQVVANVLKKIDIKISFAQSGRKAMDLMKEGDFDLILLDVMMPDMDGFEVCRLIKNQKQFIDIPVIFITAKNDIESITKAFRCGGVDYITKPFNNEELLSRVNTHLKLQAAFRQIQEQNSKLKELNATKDKFFSIIAHDLRNPFNGLLVLTELLKAKIESMSRSEIEYKVDILYQSIKDGYDLLENLLDWSRTQRNKIDFRPKNINLQKLVKGIMQLLKPMAEGKNIRLSIDIDSKTEVYADQNMLDGILRNLVSNAVKFTKDQGEVLISAYRNNNRIEVTISDTGIGIAPQDLEKLFNIESKYSTVGTAEEKGTGLGLILCKEFVEKHNGIIWVESKKGKGSQFKFTLPLPKRNEK